MLGPKFPDTYYEMTKVPLLKETRGGSSKCPHVWVARCFPHKKSDALHLTSK